MSFSFDRRWWPTRSHKACRHSEYNSLYIGDNNILRFDVTMGYVVVMEVLNCWSDLFYNSRCFRLRQDLVLLQLRIQCTLLHVLQNDEQMSAVIEKTVNSKNILVAQATLQPNLKCQLVNHHMRFYHLLRNLFQCKQWSSFSMPSYHHHPELTLTQSLPDLKILERKLCSFLLLLLDFDEFRGWGSGVRVVCRGRRAYFFKPVVIRVFR